MENVSKGNGSHSDSASGKTSVLPNDSFGAVRDVAKKAESAMNQLVKSDTAQSVVHAVEGGISGTEKWLGGLQEKTTKTIRKYPFESILVGFGVGALVAMVVRGRRHV